MLCYFPMLGTKSFAVMALAMGLLMGFTQVQTGIQPVAFAEVFPTNVRYLGLGSGVHRRRLSQAVPFLWLQHGC